MSEKLHWTKTPEGKAKLREQMKKFHSAKKTTRKYTKRVKLLTVTITGPDAYLAMTEILANHYKVTVTVERQ